MTSQVDHSAIDLTAVAAPTGWWELHRTVTDRIADRSGTVRGQLVVVAEPARIAWYESGQLVWAGRSQAVTRTSYLVQTAAGPWMTFADGRPFHPWLPGVEVEHACGEDLYRGRVEVGPDRITTVWRVTGPRKDQLLSTSLLRRGVDPAAGFTG